MTAQDENVIYTDGHGVTITPTKFHADKKEYLLKGITHINLHNKPANRAPGIILLVLGLVGLIIGALRLLNTLEYNAGDTLYIIDMNLWSMILGAVFLIVGIILLAVAKDHYAVEIGTAEGSKTPIINKDKQYVAQIVKSLNEAYYTRPVHHEVEVVI